MTSHGQRVIGVVTVIDIGDAKFDFEDCCRKGHVIVSTQVVPTEQSGRIQWSDPPSQTSVRERADHQKRQGRAALLALRATHYCRVT
ncbi:hypothetical protein OKHIF_40560 [Mycobacteroides chelonae]